MARARRDGAGQRTTSDAQLAMPSNAFNAAARSPAKPAKKAAVNLTKKATAKPASKRKRGRSVPPAAAAQGTVPTAHEPVKKPRQAQAPRPVGAEAAPPPPARSQSARRVTTAGGPSTPRHMAETKETLTAKVAAKWGEVKALQKTKGAEVELEALMGELLTLKAQYNEVAATKAPGQPKGGTKCRMCANSALKEAHTCGRARPVGAGAGKCNAAHKRAATAFLESESEEDSEQDSEQDFDEEEEDPAPVKDNVKVMAVGVHSGLAKAADYATTGNMKLSSPHYRDKPDTERVTGVANIQPAGTSSPSACEQFHGQCLTLIGALFA